MEFRVTLHQSLSDRDPLAVQAQYRLRDGSVHAWPVTVVPERGSAVLTVHSERDMLVPQARWRCLVAYYPTPPTREERLIARVRRDP